MKTVRLIKTYLNKTQCEVCTGKHLIDTYPIESGLKHGDEGDVLSLLLFISALEYAIRKAQAKRRD
jgi:hypothetical protein